MNDLDFIKQYYPNIRIVSGNKPEAAFLLGKNNPRSIFCAAFNNKECIAIYPKSFGEDVIWSHLRKNLESRLIRVFEE